MSTKIKIGIISAAVLLTLLGLSVVFVGMPMAQARAAARERFAPHLSALTDTSAFKKTRGEAYIAGKLVVINKDKYEVDSIHFSYKLDKLRAETPEDVGAIVWLECAEDQVGEYSRGSKAYQWSCDVTTIDRQKSAIVGTKMIRGEEPPSRKRGSGDWHGAWPTNEIIAYLVSLPAH